MRLFGFVIRAKFTLFCLGCNCTLCEIWFCFIMAIYVKFMLILFWLWWQFMWNLILLYNGNLCKISFDFAVKFVLPAWNCLKFDAKNLTTRGKLNICVFKLQINQTRGQSNIRQNQPKQSKFKPIITKSIAKSSKKAVHRRKFRPG